MVAFRSMCKPAKLVDGETYLLDGQGNYISRHASLPENRSSQFAEQWCAYHHQPPNSFAPLSASISNTT